MSDDSKLLQEYAAESSEAAFGEIVRRHIGFVYQTALRHLNGDAHGAQDVAQTVFCDLARKSSALAHRPQLVGWLYTSTRYAALQRLRTDRRRAIRETEAQLMQELLQESGPVAEWERLRPVIDEALGSLNPGDRDAVLMRYFEGSDFAEVGARLDLTAQGARSKVERALDKMQTSLARRGVTSTVSALGAALATQAAPLAPAGLAGAITGAALGGATAISAGAATTLGALQLMKISSVLLASSLAANAILGVMYVNDRPAAPPPTPDTPQPFAAVPFPNNAGALKAVYDPDPRVFLSRLRTAGVPENIRRALLEAAIEAQFRAREEALWPRRPEAGWWQWQDTRIPIPTALALLNLRREKVALRQELLGPDPDVPGGDSADNPVPIEKRATVNLIEEEYRAMFANFGTVAPSQRLTAEKEQIGFLEEQRRKDLAALLTPVEFAEYEKHSWPNLPGVTVRLKFFDATEAEFEAIRDSVAVHYRTMESTGRSGPADDDAEEERIRQAIGDKRLDEYDRSRRLEFRELSALLQRSGRPASDILPVYALWENIEAESHRINDDPKPSRDEKIVALRNLSARTRDGILSALGPEIGEAYIRARAFVWLQSVERGSVITFTANGFGGSAPNSPFIQPPTPRMLRKQ